MGRSSVRALVAISALVVITACSSSNEDAGGTGRVPPVDLTVKVTDVPPTGVLAGTVVDETGAPLENATVTAGTATTTTDASGAFSLAPPPGHVVLTAKATGKIPLTRSFGVTSESPAVRLKLATAGSVQKVTAAGGPVKAGAVTLGIPTGAYPSGGTVAATWIDRSHVSAASGRALFSDDAGTRHRFVGQLDVQASAQPAAPVTVQVPIPAGTPSQASLVMFANDGAELGLRVMPTSVANGFATFTLPHFSSWAVYLAVAAAEVGLAVVVTAWMVLDAGTAVVGTINGQLVKLVEGLDVPSDSEVSDATMVAPNGAHLHLDDHVSRIHTNDDGTTSSICTELCNVQAEVPPTPLPPPGVIKFLVRTKEKGGMGVRGTVFSVKQKPCSVRDGTAIDTVEVSAGDVNFSVGGADYDVPAGKQAEGCDGCKDPRQSVCDCDVVACGNAGGICDPCVGHARNNLSYVHDIGGIPNCVAKGTFCCLDAKDAGTGCDPGSYPGYALLCQCAGTDRAACATSNSVCTPLGAADCAGETLCPGNDGSTAADLGVHCSRLDTPRECGSCGNVCPVGSACYSKERGCVSLSP